MSIAIMTKNAAEETTDLRQVLKTALEVAESNNDDVRATTLRLAMCAIRDRDLKRRRKDERNGCEHADIVEILETMAAQRSEAIKEYDKAGQLDLAEQEREELDILQEFLPKMAKAEELEAVAGDVVSQLEATCLKDLGRCVAELKAKFPGKVDTSQAKAAIKKHLL